MNAREYAEMSARTMANDLSAEDQLANAAMGVAGEAGEVVDFVKKCLFHGTPMNIDTLIDEIGDVLFYVSWLLKIIDRNFSDAFEANVSKLKRRYPDGFNTEAAQAHVS